MMMIMRAVLLLGFTLAFLYDGILTGTGGPAPTTGFELSAKTSQSITIPAPWSGRMWARTHCAKDTTTNKVTCATADCGSGQDKCNGARGTPPGSLVEFTLAPDNGKDFFDLSQVDGFNLPLTITPQGGSGQNCTTTRCRGDVNSVCPQELTVKGSGGDVIACRSACAAWNQPQYCCTGSFGSPDTCKPTTYSNIFKGMCPQAYSYAYDDRTSTFTCTGGANYDIIFCE